jgi:hypothetical protein
MRKVTKYEVSGVVDTNPTNLPEGLEVREILVDAPLASVRIKPIHGGSGNQFNEFSLSGDRGNGVQIPGMGIFAESEVRKLRDFLNAILDEVPEKFVGRVLVDNVHDVWFEFEPDVWTQGNDEHDTNPNPLQRARERLNEDYHYGLIKQSLETIEHRFGPVRFIENRWEE